MKICLKHKTQVVIQNHHRKMLHNDSLNARTLIGDANCSPSFTTYGSVCVLASGTITGVQHSYTAGIGKQYGARMATAQTGLLRPRFATDCVSETICVTVAELCIYSLNMFMIIVTFMLRQNDRHGRGKKFFSSPNV